ncbi:MAG: zinc ribbon domain-containing protein [Thermoplasmata archaeon]|nr:zinc ribbon domain-containing protein [Thermoplasmata archaeon]
MESRFCVSCGRSIEFDANACPYCGYDFRPASDVAYDPIGTNTRILYYLLSFFIGLAGIIIGVIYMAKPDPDHQHVGKICLIIGIFGIFIMPIFMAAFLYIMVLGI